jgi:transposase
MRKTTIGVDISKDHLDACRWPGGETRRVGNDAAGHKTLLRWIGGELACVAFEATGAYHAAFERALHRAGVPYSKLNPVRVRRFAEALGTHAKTDRVDARLLARMGAMVEPQPRTPTPAILAELHELQLARAALIRERTATRNRAGRLTLALLERQSATRLRQIEGVLAELDAAIAARIASDQALARKAEVLCSIPGVSMVTAAAILAEMPSSAPSRPPRPRASPASRPARASPESGRVRRGSAAGAAISAARSTCQPSRPRASTPTSRPSPIAFAPRASPPSSPSSRSCANSSSSPVRDDRTWEHRA